MFSRDKSEEKAIEIQQVPTNHFREKADKALDALWESGDFNQQRLDELREVHVRDLVKSKSFLVTEDRHFNVLKTIPFPAVPIIGVDAFLQELRRQ